MRRRERGRAHRVAADHDEHAAGARVEVHGGGARLREGTVAREGERRDELARGGPHGGAVHERDAGRDRDAAQDRDDGERDRDLDERVAARQAARRGGGAHPPTVAAAGARAVSLHRQPAPAPALLPLRPPVPPRRPAPPSRAALAALAALAACLLLSGCLGMPSGDSISQGELLIELTDAMNALREHDALLQEQVDSLRTVVARQDSLLARVAAVTGVPVPPR